MKLKRRRPVNKKASALNGSLILHGRRLHSTMQADSWREQRGKEAEIIGSEYINHPAVYYMSPSLNSKIKSNFIL